MPQSRSERIAGVFIYIILSFITPLCSILCFVLIASISAPETVMRGSMVMAEGIVVCRLRAVIRQFGSHAGIHEHAAVYDDGTALNVLMTIAAAYPLSRADFNGRGILRQLSYSPCFSAGNDSELLAGEGTGDARYDLGDHYPFGRIRVEHHYYADLLPELHSEGDAGGGVY